MGRGLTRLIPGMRFSSVAEAEGDAGLRAADLRSQNPLSMDTRRTLLARRRIVLPRSGGVSHVTQVVLYLRKSLHLPKMESGALKSSRFVQETVFFSSKRAEIPLVLIADWLICKLGVFT